MNPEGILEKIKLHKEKIFNIYIAFLILITILFSRNTLISTSILSFETTFFASAILYIPLIIIFIIKLCKKQIILNNIKPIIALVAIISISVILKRDWQMYNVTILYYIIVSTIMILLVDFEKIKKYYINIIFFFAVFSLITTYVVKPIIFANNWENNLVGTFLVVKNPVNYQFLNLIFGFSYFDINYDRNYGIFTEPSFFQFYLIMATLMLAFSKEKNKFDYIKIVIFIITTITTKSTAGIVVLALIMLTYFIKYIIENRKNRKKVCMAFGALIVIIALLFIIPNTRSLIKRTYSKITTENDSSLSRFGSIQYSLDCFVKSPIVGNKISNILMYEEHLTNTIFAIAAIYGIFAFICLLCCNFKLATKFKQNKFICACLFITIVLAYNSHIFIGVQSFWILALLGMAKEREEIDEDSMDS